MDKNEFLQKLVDSGIVSKETSPQALWDQLKEIEDSIQSSLDEVETMEDLLVSLISEEDSEDESKDFDSEAVLAVAKAKGLPEPDGSFIRKFMGVSVSSKSIEADTTKGMKGKRSAEDYLPSDEELSKINSLSNIDFKKDGVMVFTLVSADQNIDRSYDQFSNKALKDMAEMSPDKPYLRDHSWKTESVVGKIFDAAVSKGRLIQKVYVPITSKNADVIQGMLHGTLNKVSVGFAMAPMDYVCSSCSKSLYSMECSHYPGAKDKEGKEVIGLIKGVKDYFEISNVAVPCQPAAGIRRSEQKSIDSTKEAIEGVIEAGQEFNKSVEDLVDKISNDKSLGANPLEEINKEPETKATEEVVEPAAPAEEVTVPAEKSVAPAAQEVDLKAVIKEAFSEVASELKTLVAELKATIETKKEAEKSVEDESTEEIARKLAATKVDSPDAANSKPVDYTKSGWGVSILNAFNPTNQ